MTMPTTKKQPEALHLYERIKGDATVVFCDPFPYRLRFATDLLDVADPALLQWDKDTMRLNLTLANGSAEYGLEMTEDTALVFKRRKHDWKPWRD